MSPFSGLKRMMKTITVATFAKAALLVVVGAQIEVEVYFHAENIYLL